jgi:phosphohistidine phosphatase SixA
MGRTVYIIRHGTTEGNRYNQASFGPEGGALTEQGIQEAQTLYGQLKGFGLDPFTEPVASSYMKRAYETAKYAGFKQINKYTSLNEVGGDLPPEVLGAMLESKEAPLSAIVSAQSILKQPPPEKVWVTHGQLIAGLAYALGIPPSVLFIPRMGSITKLNISIGQ